MSKKKIAILYGGRSVEHGVSINSARNIFEFIDRKKFEPVLIGITAVEFGCCVFKRWRGKDLHLAFTRDVGCDLEEIHSATRKNGGGQKLGGIFGIGRHGIRCGKGWKKGGEPLQETMIRILQ